MFGIEHNGNDGKVFFNEILKMKLSGKRKKKLGVGDNMLICYHGRYLIVIGCCTSCVCMT